MASEKFFPYTPPRTYSTDCYPPVVILVFRGGSGLLQLGAFLEQERCFVVVLFAALLGLPAKADRLNETLGGSDLS